MTSRVGLTDYCVLQARKGQSDFKASREAREYLEELCTIPSEMLQRCVYTPLPNIFCATAGFSVHFPRHFKGKSQYTPPECSNLPLQLGPFMTHLLSVE